MAGSKILMELHKVSAIAQAEVHMAVFETQCGMPAHLEPAQMFAAHFILAEKVDAAGARLEFPEIHSRNYIFYLGVDFGMAIGLNPEIEAEFGSKIEALGYRHTITYVDRHVEINKRDVSFLLDSIEVFVVDEIFFVKEETRVKPGTDIERQRVAYAEVDGITYTKAVGIDVVGTFRVKGGKVVERAYALHPGRCICF